MIEEYRYSRITNLLLFVNIERVEDSFQEVFLQKLNNYLEKNGHLFCLLQMTKKDNA